MAILKCKLCGGTIENIKDGIGVCDSCGTKQTIPKISEDRVLSFLDRANSYRMAGEFDKAIEIYEKLLDNNENEDPELYFNIAICNYGVKYEKDPTSGEYIPTVNRLQYTSILQDTNYLKALELAGSIQKSDYVEKATVIDKIQREILEISNSEEPYDIFICYKETDDGGNRTQDSLYAYKLYEKLVGEGYKVFFARVSLEDKIGKYEPYIFAALHSAKVMLVVGTKKEYFEAVWVKNEWSRYMQLLKDKSVKRNIVPCYKDMDPYDLPQELAYLQAQDMNKVGFEEDLIRGIKKVINKRDASKDVNKGINTSNNEVESLLKRAKNFLEEKNWEKADEYCEKALDINSECGVIYLYKLLIEAKQSNLEDVASSDIPTLKKFDNYQKILNYGDAELINKINTIQKQCVNKKFDVFMNDSQYDKALELVNSEIDDVDLKKIMINRVHESKINHFININYFYAALDYINHNVIDENIKNTYIGKVKAVIYNLATNYYNKGEFSNAIESYEYIKDYLDSNEKIDMCHKKMKEIDEQKEAERRDKAEKWEQEHKGCYVATCVYGSYDCPEVWVLRRYRDINLKSTWHGKIFIKIYYTVSPTIVKFFGKTKLFRTFFKNALDKWVTELKNNGYKDTKYYD